MNRDLTPKPLCILSPKTLLAFMFLSHELCAVCQNSLQSNLTVQNTLHNIPYLLYNLLKKRNVRRSHQSLLKRTYEVEEGTSSLWTIKIKVCEFTLNKTAHLCINLHVKGHQSLVKLAEHNRIKKIWVPGYKEIDENEIPDQLARESSSNPFTGP